MQELSVFADDIVSQFDRANRAKDQVARLSLDIDAVKQELNDSKICQAQLEEQLQERMNETTLKSQNIEKLEYRLLTMKRNCKYPDYLHPMFCKFVQTQYCNRSL